MPPTGKYKNVNATSITGGNNLAGGTGTYDDATKTMSCGPWAADNRPKMDDYYNIKGTFETDNQFYTFDKYHCLTSDNTSNFRDANATARKEKAER